MRAETIIATHANTDFDALASMLAVRRLYPGSVVCVSGSLNRNVRELCRLYAEELELDAVRRLIVVEAVSASRLGEVEPVALDPAVEKVVFDHHVSESPDWARPDNVVLSEDGALTTTLVGILAEREIAVSALEATVFALGIHEDTGSLTYASATQRDADALSWCLRHGARQDMLARYLHTPLSEEERALLDAFIDALETHELPGITALVAAVSWPSYVEGVSNLAHKIVDLTDARALVLLAEMDRRVFCVVRSRTPSFDAAAVAAALGGGGHGQAASAIYRGRLGDAKRDILAALPTAVEDPLRARDVMSKPARVVAPGDTVAEAMALCQRYNQSGVLVTEDGKLVGSVAREDLDRAIGHGLSHAPVKGIMSGRALEAEADTPLPELQQLLADSAEGRIAIVDGEAVAGVVTRRDVLRALDEAAEPADDAGESIAAELRALPRLERRSERGRGRRASRRRHRARHPSRRGELRCGHRRRGRCDRVGAAHRAGAGRPNA
jgi:tRNA nucleotidyltransferase (CCA-adding enzyme)